MAPYPKWYNPNVHCNYHVRATGDTTEDCTALKYKVRDLMKVDALKFENNVEPNVTNNALLKHASAK